MARTVADVMWTMLAQAGVTRCYGTFHAAKSFTLSLAKQALSGQMDTVIQTIKRNVRLV